MPDLDQIKQGEHGPRDRCGRVISTGVCRNSRTFQGTRRGRRRGRRIEVASQPIGERLLLICCRCSNVKYSLQMLVVVCSEWERPA
jgi:hypothetical protein